MHPNKITQGSSSYFYHGKSTRRSFKRTSPLKPSLKLDNPALETLPHLKVSGTKKLFIPHLPKFKSSFSNVPSVFKPSPKLAKPSSSTFEELEKS